MKQTFKFQIVLLALSLPLALNAQSWSTTGNAGTISSNFIGTTDNKDLKIRTNNVARITIKNNGKVGIGTTAPNEKLEITGNIRLTRGAARSLYIDDAPAGTNGSDLTVQAGGTPIFNAGPTSGGNLSITAGNSNHSSAQAGGNIIFTTGRNVWNNGVNPGAKHGDFIFNGGGLGSALSIVEHARIDGTTGAMALGTAAHATGYKLTVAGKIICTELKVQAQPFPDYVFESSYDLKTIDQVEQHINTYKRLPGMPSACEVETDGMSMGEMQVKTVEKVEEMMLYIIQLKNQNEALQQRIELLEKN